MLSMLLKLLRTVLAWAGWAVLGVVAFLLAWLTLWLFWSLARLGWHELRRRMGAQGLGPRPRLPFWLRG